MKLFYEELAAYWPLVSPVEEYAEEAAEVLRLIEQRAPEARTLLELGSGGGHMAFHLKGRFAMTLTDLSAEMLEVSKKLNLGCDHFVGDMRALDLSRSFDVVFVHDAIDYMTTEADLERVFATAHRHLNPGGLFVICPDTVKERYAPDVDCGGSDSLDGRGIRFLEWDSEVGPTGTAGTTHYAFLVRAPDGSVRCLHEAHPFGVFPQRTWVELLEKAGFEVEVVEERTSDDRQPRLLFVARKEPRSEKNPGPHS